MEVAQVIVPQSKRIPILVSVPHCGTAIPEDIASGMNPRLLPPDDTDFYVERLYEFVLEMGATMVHANYSRWVIDLNRDPESKPLYSDGRVITGLVTETDFLGNPIYLHDLPSGNDVIFRLENFYKPYHSEISHQLKLLQQEFKHVLLFDAHSIRKHVSSIHKDPFPDLILGDNIGRTSHPLLIESAWEVISNSPYTSSHNYPFKGGYITRSFGNPDQSIHALQLEMSKINYMDDAEVEFAEERADKMRVTLKRLFESLTLQLKHLNS